MPHREQVATIATKTAGSMKAGTGMVQLVGHYQSEIITLCTVVGAVITVISFFTMRHYQKKRDRREEELHQLKIKGLQGDQG